MHDEPDKTALLEALAEFLMTEIKPAIDRTGDARLGFRVLIAANLAAICARDVRAEDAENADELEQLRALVPEVIATPPADAPGRRAAIRQLRDELGRRLATGQLGVSIDLDATRKTLMQLMKARLAVDNPFFDTRLSID